MEFSIRYSPIGLNRGFSRGECKMHRYLVFLLLIIAFISFSGCSRFALDARDIGEPVSMTRETGLEQSNNAVPFETSMRVGYCGWLFNLVTLKNADMSEMLAKEIKAAGGTAVRNVTVKKEMSFVDGLISVVSLGFYVPETITVTGEVVSK